MRNYCWKPPRFLLNRSPPKPAASLRPFSENISETLQELLRPFDGDPLDLPFRSVHLIRIGELLARSK